MKNIKRYLMILIGLTLLVGLGACGKSNKTDMNSAMSTAVQETITMGETRTAIARPSDTHSNPTMMLPFHRLSQLHHNPLLI